MGSSNNLRLRFWGVRGSTPTPQRENLGYGGNTACVELRCNNDILIFDLGTGVRKLGESLTAEHAGGPMNLHVFLTHYHWDHLQGFPFFGPAYNPANRITFYASAKLGSIRDHLRGQMRAPYFPVEFDQMRAQMSFIEYEDGPLAVGVTRLFPFPMHHPQGAFGYRVESPNGVIVYASDSEHGHDAKDTVLRMMAEGADVLIYDSQYTPDEYVVHAGWGHSHWMEATKLARDAGVKKLFLFHHDPLHDDATMDRIEAAAREQFSNSRAAREGMVVEVPEA